MTKKKNILFITSDQQHWLTMGKLNPEIKTPNLDKLADMGTTFTRAYTVNPTCTPTRASWITGLYPSQHGAWSLGTKLQETVPVIGDMMRESGMHSTLIGKAHFQPLASTEEFSSLESYPILQDLEFWRQYSDQFYGFDHVELARNHTNEAHAGQHYGWKRRVVKTGGTIFFHQPGI
jgi:arylsulfatase A-like enzyme